MAVRRKGAIPAPVIFFLSELIFFVLVTHRSHAHTFERGDLLQGGIQEVLVVIGLFLLAAFLQERLGRHS
jgi:hypothetical protein